MGERDSELGRSFLEETIDALRIDKQWDGSGRRLSAGETLHMPKTPDGPLVVAYRIAPKLNQMATLTLTTPGKPPKIVMIQPGADLPGIVTRDWAGQELFVTNISHADGIEIWVTAMGVIPGKDFEDLPENETRVFGSGQSAQIPTQVGFQQVLVDAQSPEQTLFALIVGASANEDSKALVFAAYAEDNTGPGTEKEPPPGYYATTTASNFSYESIVAEEAERPSALFLKNISYPSEESEHAQVRWRILG